MAEASRGPVPPELLAEVAACHGGADAEFFQRVWSAGLDPYAARLRAVGFTGHEHVLDCGFGMAQWLVALAGMNGRVSGLDVSPTRVAGARLLQAGLGLSNVELTTGSIETLPYPDASFDAVFCYGVIFLADVERSLAELHRVLRPSGRLYVTANGLGWFLFLLLEEHNKSEAYDPRAVAAHAIETTITHRPGDAPRPDRQFVVPAARMRRLLEERGYAGIRMGPEGSLSVDPGCVPRSFYRQAAYLGYEMVYEVLCSR